MTYLTKDRRMQLRLAVVALILVMKPSVFCAGAAPVKNPVDGLRAFRYLEQLCDLGPRPSGSEGMLKQQELVRRHFEKLGGKVTM